MKSYFNKILLIKLSLAMLALMALCKVTQGAAFAVMVPITFVMILQGRNTSVLFIILFSTFAMLFNGFFMPKGFVFFISQKVLLLIASCFLMLQAFGRHSSRIMTPFLMMFPFLLFMFITSQRGWAPNISNLKLLLFTVLYLGMYGSAVRAMNARTDLRQLRTLCLFIAVFILIGSVLVWPIKSISIMGAEALLKNPDAKSLYQGTTNHSQALGGLAACLGTFLWCDWIFCIQRKSRLYLALLICAAIFVYVSQSRTAMATFVVGIGFATLCAKRRSLIGALWRRKMVSIMIGVGMLGGVAVLAVPSLREKAMSFVVKYNTEGKELEISSESILSSRQFKLNSALDNWRRSPWIGNGFQVSEEMHYTKVNGLKDMLSAPVEKSTWTHAILEEGGVVGMALFLLFVLVVMVQLMRHRAYFTATMFVMFLVSNLGEFSIFSMSGGGGIQWSMIFVAAVFDFKRLQVEQQLVSQRRLRFSPWG